MAAFSAVNSTTSIPVRVAVADLTAQTAAIAATTIYAVPAGGAGQYRVSWVASVTTAATTSSVLGGTTGFQLVYTDQNDSATKTTTSDVTALNIYNKNLTSASISGVLMANCKLSTNLQYAFGYTSVGGTAMQYNLHIVVEYLT